MLYTQLITLGHSFPWCDLERGTSPSRVSLHSGINVYLVGRRWQCVRLVPSDEMAAELHATRGSLNST